MPSNETGPRNVYMQTYFVASLLEDDSLQLSALSQLIEAEWNIYASVDQVVIVSDNGLTPYRHKANILNNVVLSLVEHLGTSEIPIKITKFHCSIIIYKFRLQNGGHIVSASLCVKRLLTALCVTR